MKLMVLLYRPNLLNIPPYTSWRMTTWLSQDQHVLPNDHSPCRLALMILAVVKWMLRNLGDCRDYGEHIAMAGLKQGMKLGWRLTPTLNSLVCMIFRKLFESEPGAQRFEPEPEPPEPEHRVQVQVQHPAEPNIDVQVQVQRKSGRTCTE